MQEDEIRRIVVLGQPGPKKKKKSQNPISTEKSWRWFICLPYQLWEMQNRRIAVQVGLGKKQDPISKITRAKRTGGCRMLA
jgi:hypothetical protein